VNGLRIPTVTVEQVTFYRPGLSPIFFRTALLVESADLIVGRIERATIGIEAAGEAQIAR